MSTTENHAPRFIFPLLTLGVLVLGGLGTAILIATAPRAPKAAPESKPTAVRVATLRPEDRRAKVDVLGTVVAAEQVTVTPQVGGMIRSIHPRLSPGGVLPRGAELAQIDARDYRLAVEQQKAQVANAEYALQVEKGQQRVAKREWELLKKTTRGDADEALALRKPHLAKAEADLAAAEAQLSAARLDLSRTSLTAPFDALVISENLDVGQVVGTGASVASLVGTDAFWVRAAVPMVDVGFLSDEEGATAVVSATHAFGPSTRREGKVLRLLGDLDTTGKTARLLVEVKDPLALEEGTEGKLLLGSVVRVEVEGKTIENVLSVPRTAFREGGQLWIVRGDKLAIIDVEVAWRGRDEVFVRAEGLGSQVQVVTSRLGTPVDGMSVRIVEGDS